MGIIWRDNRCQIHSWHVSRPQILFFAESELAEIMNILEARRKRGDPLPPAPRTSPSPPTGLSLYTIIGTLTGATFSTF